MKKCNLFFSILSLLLIITSLSFCFISGSFSSSLINEKSADYSAKIASMQTESKKYCGIAVQRGQSDAGLPDSFHEFGTLYGIFGSQRVTFGCFLNLIDQKDFKCYEMSDNNISLFYLGPVGTSQYNGHYRHYIYPFEVMFEDEKIYEIENFVSYISQTHADKILQNRGVEKTEGIYTTDDYKSLVKTIITFDLDGKSVNSVIQNIYYETGNYYSAMEEIAGDLIFTSYYYPYAFEKANVYFFTDVTFKNLVFMNHIEEIYSNKKYDLRLCQKNIIGDVNTDDLFNFYYEKNNASNDFVCYLLISMASIFVIAFFVLSLLNNKKHWYYYLSCGVSLFIPYLVFKCVYTVSGNVSFYSSFGLITNALFAGIYVVSFLLLISIYIILKKRRKTSNE